MVEVRRRVVSRHPDLGLVRPGEDTGGSSLASATGDAIALRGLVTYQIRRTSSYAADRSMLARHCNSRARPDTCRADEHLRSANSQVRPSAGAWRRLEHPHQKTGSLVQIYERLPPRSGLESTAVSPAARTDIRIGRRSSRAALRAMDPHSIGSCDDLALIADERMTESTIRRLASTSTRSRYLSAGSGSWASTFRTGGATRDEREGSQPRALHRS